MIEVSKGTPDVARTSENVLKASVQCLDTGEEFPPTCTKLGLSMGQTLVDFLRSLDEPVIPWRFHSLCANAKDRDEAYGVSVVNRQRPPGR